MGRRGSAIVRVVALTPILTFAAVAVASCATGSTDDFGAIDGSVPSSGVDAAGASEAAQSTLPDATMELGDVGDVGEPGDDAEGDGGGDTGDDAAESVGPDGALVVEAGGDMHGTGGDSGWGDATPGDGATAESHDAAGVDGASDASVPDATSGDGGPTEGGGRDASAEGGSSDASAEGGAVDAGPCGGCPSGFSCGAGKYCRTSTGVPAFGHVFVIMLDDQQLSAVQASSSAPYLNQLMATYAYGTNYKPADHPSLPNYLALTSGNPQGVACDCAPGGTSSCSGGNCSIIASQCNCPLAVSHLGDELDVAGIGWREYAESMGSACNPAGAADGGPFAASHVPFLYYDDVFGNAGRCAQRVVDYSNFAGDLSKGQYRFSLISPDLCDDMHSNCTGDAVKQGDTWLAAQVPPILATAGFASGGSDVLFIVGDEPFELALGLTPVPFVVVSPLVKKGATTGAYDHYSLLATIADGLGVPRLGNAEGASTIADVWR
jgi:hypothetical protein